MKRSAPQRTGFKPPQPAPRAQIQRKRAKPIPFASDKTKARRPERKAVVEQVHERDQSCRAAEAFPDIECTPWQLDVHEVLTRGRGGSPYDASNAILLCRNHHRWITEHPIEARAGGFVRNSWED